MEEKHLVKYHATVKKDLYFWLVQDTDDNKNRELEKYFELNYADYWFDDEVIDVERIGPWEPFHGTYFRGDEFFKLSFDCLEKIFPDELDQILESLKEYHERKKQMEEFNKDQLCLNFKK